MNVRESRKGNVFILNKREERKEQSNMDNRATGNIGQPSHITTTNKTKTQHNMGKQTNMI